MILWMFVPYLLGGAGLFFYLTRYPERLVRRGRVDLCGASHQLWHLLILAGQYICTSEWKT
jgi:predicted membrane channel-forming protein YqfA (hemolysin III family)